MGDLISRKAAIDALKTAELGCEVDAIKALPSAEPDSCYGCKHIGQWENEVEYGYPSPCTRCKRRASDNYELRSKE